MGDGIPVYWMYDISGELTVILTTVWWLQRLGKTGSKQESQNSDVERFNLGELNELEVWKRYQITGSNRFVAWENLSDSESIKRVWQNTEETIKISPKESSGL
jgi:hypothetical protein